MLPEFQLSAFWLSLFYPTSQRNSVKFKPFLELITQTFTETPPWDRSLIGMGLLSRNFIE